MGSLSRLHKTSTIKSSKVIREEFLNYFSKNLGHAKVRSSPVLPLNDKSVAFVNAGMNQFKGIFLDLCKAPASKVVSTQKCIRVGGKHNDLDLVGTDTYHHTFFEMLGNWSFNDYFKKEACEYAWNLLTGPYEIKKECLYVTYFGGDEEHDLPPDLECREIWLNIGLPENKVVPCGMKDNFWEMGSTGPCGPCTEIHVDQNILFNQPNRINNVGSNFIELWNLVFMQYQRMEDGSIESLKQYHIDTGMGFERLVALLQGKVSNYDTDIFQSLFTTIQKYTGAPNYKGLFNNSENDIDYGYRILADHGRMITVALADNILPEKNPKLRRILRKCLDIGETTFKKTGILQELAYTITEDLGNVYPELQHNLSQVHTILKFEEELTKRLQVTSAKEWSKLVQSRPELKAVSDYLAPGLIQAYKYMQDELFTLRKNNILSGNVAFKLYDTYGLNLQTINELAHVEALKFDKAAFEEKMSNIRYRSKIGFEYYERHELLKKLKSLPKTLDTLKYEYVIKGDTYEFPIIKCKVLALILNGTILSENQFQELLSKNDKIVMDIVLDRTGFYSTEGGQIHDKGYIFNKDFTLEVDEVEKVEGYCIHHGILQKPDKEMLKELKMNKLKEKNDCFSCIDQNIRIGAMRHHTATHLLNATLNEMIPVLHQASSTVHNDYLKFKYNSYGKKLNLIEIENIETLINNIIKADAPVVTKVIDIFQLINEGNIKLIPGEIYPYSDIRTIEINTGNFKSKEACCGTHIHQTGFLKHFCITDYFSKSVLYCGIKAVVGPKALQIRKESEEIFSRILNVESSVLTLKDHQEISNLHSEIVEIEKILKNNKHLSYSIRGKSLVKLEKLKSNLKIKETQAEKNNLITELRTIVQSTTSPFIVQHFKSNTFLSVEDIITLDSHKPILFITHDKNIVKALAYVPKEIVSNDFSARSWLKGVAKVFNAKEEKIYGFDVSVVSSTKPTKFKGSKSIDLKSYLEEAITKASKLAEMYTSRRI